MSKGYIMNSPIIGWGMGSAGDTLSLYKISNVYTTTHSMYYKIWMETGIVGFAFYLGIFIFVILQLNRIQNYRNKSLGFGVLAIILLNGIVGSTISTFPCLTLFWIIVMLLISGEENNCAGGNA
jgi:O-antigen ligase